LALVAEDEAGRLVGLAQYLFHATTWSPAPRCYLNDLFAVPEARGRGVGKSLIEAVYAAADARGASQVYWLTQTFNFEARQLYDRIAKATPFIKYAR
jgi:GNAT superfamily N-acetyltransferase